MIVETMATTQILLEGPKGRRSCVAMGSTCTQNGSTCLQPLVVSGELKEP